MYKGHEELKDMKKSDMINLWKDNVNPHRKKGGVRIITKTSNVVRKDAKGDWYDYELTSYYSQESVGTNMSEFRPKIGEDEYTWGELEKYPADMIRIFLYQYIVKREDKGEEE
jgi:hypothetical protein